MSSRYSIVEPHPSVSVTQRYIGTGRGGAGNAVKPPTTVTRGSDASGPARASTACFVAPRQSFVVGRGGAGNLVHEAPRMFSFDEELQHQMQQSKRVAPVYHVGRGGAGNLHHRSSDASTNAKLLLSRRDSNNSSSSTSSAESGADIATRNMKKGFKKLAGIF